jgi:segregation and condensation protein A
VPNFSRSTPFGAAYPVTLTIFQGPLDLLLHLIEREELDINQVSLMAVTDQYLQTLEQLEEIEPGALSDFLVVASRLLYLKSCSLLPKLLSSPEEDEEDSSDALIRQLLAYRQFKQAAAGLKEREDQGLRVYVRTAPGPAAERRLDLSDIDMLRLREALRRALQRLPVTPPLPTVHAYTITVAEQMEVVRRAILEMQPSHKGEAVPSWPAPVAFSALLNPNPSRIEIVVTFLAVLEMIKQQELQAVQESTFGEIALLPVIGKTGGK